MNHICPGAGSVFDTLRLVTSIVQDYHDLAKILPQFQNTINVATHSLISFEAEYNPVKTYSRLVYNRPTLKWHQIRDIDAFIGRYQRFLEGLKRSWDTAAGEVHYRRKCVKMALTGRASASVEGLQQQHQLLMTFMNQMSPYKSLLRSDDQDGPRSILDNLNISLPAIRHYRDPHLPQLPKSQDHHPLPPMDINIRDRSFHHWVSTLKK